ncbi:hypothetical protein [Sphingomonas sp. KR3-1]|uniref:hypothetical protein n=1 Tax=Sphingomonas sp. KR3-1 TaxID=3156611 RepID=UPI0032B5B896
MNRRALTLLAIAFTVMTAGLILVLIVRFPGAHPHQGNAGFLAFIPIYTAMIPIFIASRRRNSACANEKKNG